MAHRKVSVFGHKKKFHSHFSSQQILEWIDDSTGMKYVPITIPLTHSQYQQLVAIQESYQMLPPYDYAFIGMRCAAATYDILSQIGVLSPYRRNRLVIRYFYPKLLRKRFLKLAKERGYSIRYQAGRSTRKWEKE